MNLWRSLCYSGVFCDASLRNLHDLHSTGGLFAVLGPVVGLDGEPVPLSPVGWRSWKLDRKALSSNHAEVQACNTSESLLFRLRVCWASLNLSPGPTPGEIEIKAKRYQLCKSFVGVLISNSNGVYDATTGR